MHARLVFQEKVTFIDGAILEMVVWELPEKTAERPHGFKYRLHYGLPGKTLVRYDNETGKGDHRHVGNEESAYVFKNVDTLRSDFFTDVEVLRGESCV